MSLAVFTDSTTAHASPAFTLRPTAGNSTNTTSVSSCCAWSVMPAVGRKVKAGEACAVVESVKTASDIYSPASGEVIEVNKAVTDDPGLVNGDPYTGGWFFKLKLADAAEAGALLTPEAYKAQIGG